MKVINQKAHVDGNGQLRIDLATELPESDVELVVVINQLQDEDEFSKEEISMLEERWEEYVKNPAEGKSWEDVKAELKSKYDI